MIWAIEFSRKHGDSETNSVEDAAAEHGLHGLWGPNYLFGSITPTVRKNLSDFGFTRRYYLLLSEAYVEVGKSMHAQAAG